VLIVDIDTRVPNGPNELWHDGRMNWESLSDQGDGGMVSASFMNHFLYCKYNGPHQEVWKASNVMQPKYMGTTIAS
jgi:hypothetical protein